MNFISLGNKPVKRPTLTTLPEASLGSDPVRNKKEKDMSDKSEYVYIPSKTEKEIFISQAEREHHAKYFGLGRDENGPCCPTPEKVVELGLEPESYLERFKK